MQDFQTFIERKPLYYKEINHKRVHHAYSLLKPHIKHPRTVHIIGTNGKGSTGRILAHLAYHSGLCIGHFSSPHIVKFNERIWIDGCDSSDEVLEHAHQRLFPILGQEMSESLSYFEYTTLLALVVFEECDLMILEAGLGGEFDASNVCDKELSIITPIGLDHQAFLGETIEEIAGTKIRSIQNKVLLALQPYSEVFEVAKEIALKKEAELFIYEKADNMSEQLLTIIKEKSWADYLADNAGVALKALDILGIKYEINDLLTVELFGRFYALTKNIRIDVGHNPLAAVAIEKVLDERVILIYNSLDDKDYEEVLRILQPKVKHVEIIDIHSQRVTTQKEIKQALNNLGIPYSDYEGSIQKNEKYLVFGSFYVVEEFLKRFNVSK